MNQKTLASLLALAILAAEPGYSQAPEMQGDQDKDPATIMSSSQLEKEFETVCAELAMALSRQEKEKVVSWLSDWEQKCGAGTAGDDKKQGCADWIVDTTTNEIATLAENTLARHSGLLSRLQQFDDPTRIGRLEFSWRRETNNVANHTAADFRARVRNLVANLKATAKEDLVGDIASASQSTAQHSQALCAKSLASVVGRFSRPEEVQRAVFESAYYQTLQKQEGFSPIVRCHWRRGVRDFLECTPGLRISAQVAGTIVIHGPTDAPDFSLGRVLAQSVEVNNPQLSKLRDAVKALKLDPPIEGDLLRVALNQALQFRCGGLSDLACDEITFSSDSDHTLPRATALVGVHKGRALFGTTYDCQAFFGTRYNCASQKLRGASREHLSLVLRGQAPALHIIAQDAATGDIASGIVLIGYERWRFETGGFIALTEQVDKKLVTVPTGDGNVRVTAIRSADDYESETGIFANFIPSNYETLGVGLGFSTSDDNRLTIFIGPSLRLRSFGDRGVAALTAGALFKPVRRFPDVRVGDEVASDASPLQGELRTRAGFFFGIQLGFSFGPIGEAE